MKRSPVLDAMERQGFLKGRKQGKKEGREEGKKEGKKEGREEGREEGIKEGREQGIIKVLKDLANNGTPIDELAEKYGYTVDGILNNDIN
ncbi:hypothetical protein [Methanobrevibacter sp.]|uniref:hypothetical protein n=1 Tax=Methanobrevibacter sp. TaxID=66852 RepID=UPI00388DA8A7